MSIKLAIALTAASIFASAAGSALMSASFRRALIKCSQIAYRVIRPRESLTLDDVESVRREFLALSTDKSVGLEWTNQREIIKRSASISADVASERGGYLAAALRSAFLHNSWRECVQRSPSAELTFAKERLRANIEKIAASSVSSISSPCK
jgi:hypothetical protein